MALRSFVNISFLYLLGASPKWHFRAAWEFRLGFEQRELRFAPTSACSQPAFTPRCGRSFRGHRPDFIRVLAFQVCPEMPLRHGANVVFNDGAEIRTAARRVRRRIT